jgi:endonuclease/exonuclease/phosphatase family metal-dependent hydrolase
MAAVGRGTGVAVAAVATLVVLVVAGGVRAAEYRHTYLQYNLCGNACSEGGYGVVDELAGWIERRRPYAVTLNEVCENQYERLRADLGAYVGFFEPTARCRTGARYGNVILVRSTDVARVGSWELPNPAGDERRRLLCVRAHRLSAGPLVVCVTHISNYAGNIAAQVEVVAAHVNRIAVDQAVLVGGDFNTDPADSRLDPLYRACGGSGAGAFHEADSSGCAVRSPLNQPDGADVINEDTYNRHKYDYLFLSDGDWSSFTADATDPDGFSDHDPLWATAVVGAP